MMLLYLKVEYAKIFKRLTNCIIGGVYKNYGNNIKGTVFSSTAAKDGYLQRRSNYPVKRKSLFWCQQLQGHGLSTHGRSTDIVDYYFWRWSRSKPVKRKLTATSVNKTCCPNEGDTFTACSKHATGRRKSSTPESPIGPKNSQNGIPCGDQSAHRNDLRDSKRQ